VSCFFERTVGEKGRGPRVVHDPGELPEKSTDLRVDPHFFEEIAD
jgi:hypothetical protein